MIFLNSKQLHHTYDVTCHPTVLNIHTKNTQSGAGFARIKEYTVKKRVN